MLDWSSAWSIWKQPPCPQRMCVSELAGASPDHLPKQLVALDEWGVSVEREISLVRQNPNIYNELVVNFSGHSNFVIAENDYAVALAEIGHR